MVQQKSISTNFLVGSVILGGIETYIYLLQKVKLNLSFFGVIVKEENYGSSLHSLLKYVFKKYYLFYTDFTMGKMGLKNETKGTLEWIFPNLGLILFYSENKLNLFPEPETES